MTLIDSLDTLIVLGNYTEFARSVERLRNLHTEMAEENGVLGGGGLFALNKNVSVFETNIRVLGGLLSAHQLAEATISAKVLETDVWDNEKNVLIGRDSSKMTCNEVDVTNTGHGSEDLSVKLRQVECKKSSKDSSKNSSKKFDKKSIDFQDLSFVSINSTTGIAIPGGHRDLSQGLNSLHCVGGHANSQGIAACCVDAVKRIQMKN